MRGQQVLDYLLCLAELGRVQDTLRSSRAAMTDLVTNHQHSLVLSRFINLFFFCILMIFAAMLASRVEACRAVCGTGCRSFSIYTFNVQTIILSLIICLQIAALSVLNNLDMVEQAVAASASASASTVLPQSGRLLLNNGRVTLDFANM